MARRLGPIPAWMLPEQGDGAEKFRLVVDLAGLVLVHPFVPRLFENLGLLGRGQTKLDDPVRGRAAALLHWLGSGRQEIHEFEIPFIKVLLGLTPETELMVSGDCLETGDREEADNMLGSVVANWPALKGTSIGGLRSTFLDRPGYLREIGNGWSLEFDRRTVDLLIDRLPWAISVVRMPWSTNTIYTKW